MRLSKLFTPTLREDPAEAEAASHKLLLRAGFIRPVIAGVFTILPLGLRTTRRIEAIVREEMDTSGAQEIRMPILLPSEPWRQTGRLEAYGPVMFKLVDRHERELVLGPTQEEVVTPLVAGDLPSYRDLPVNLYQVEWKYRDEYRPRYGLLRVREFLMKDAYTFDRDAEGLRASYEVMKQSYRRVFDRCGLSYVVVEADPGQIGGGTNHEFMAVADVGEDLYVSCPTCDYLADTEAASPGAPEPVDDPPLEPLVEVHTPGASTIAAVSAFLQRPAAHMLKNILFEAGETVVAALVPGDREVNQVKLERRFFPTPVRPFEDAEFEARGYVKGFVGPHGLADDVVILADPSVRGRPNWVTGANRLDHHVTGANTPRDFRVDAFVDLVEIREGDPCPNDGAPLHIERSIVVGHIYQLGTRYSEPLKARFLDEDGTERPYEMGSYGIGITRIMAAAAEQFHDEAGLRWPKVLAPFEVVVVIANRDDDRVMAEAERVYAELAEAGVAVAIDDREETAGVKFADADLIGYPVQVTVGKRGVAAGTADLKLRATGERSTAPLPGAARGAMDLLERAP